MASPKVPNECGICLEDYDATHRPRTLPCGHNFCGPCIQNCISQGGKTCCVCRKAYSATSLTDIPINTDIEKFTQSWEAMALNTAKTNDSSDEDDDFSSGKCPRHKKSLLYFKCKSHSILICHQCAVIEHSPSKCDVIEIKEEFMILKDETLKKAHQNISRINTTTTSLESIVSEKNEIINSKEAQIECLLKEIEEETKVRNQVQKKIVDNKSHLGQFQTCVERLQSAKSKKEISKQSTEVQNKVDTLGKHLVEIEQMYDAGDITKILLKDYKRRALIEMKKRKLVVYAVDGDNIIRSSEILAMDGSLQITSLKKDVRPAPNSTMILVSSILSGVAAQPVVFLDLEAGAKHLGRIKIRLTCGPRRQEQILLLCTAWGGSTWQGSEFSDVHNVGRDGERVWCRNYINSAGVKSASNIVQDMELDQSKWCKEGSVNASGGSLGICTRTDQSDPTKLLKIGYLVSGLDLLRKALGQYANNITQIKIVEAGVEI